VTNRIIIDLGYDIFVKCMYISIFFSSPLSRLALGPMQSPIQWVLGALSFGVKQQGSEAERSPPSSAQVKNCGAIPPIPHIVSWYSAQMLNSLNTGTIFPYVYT
jgi:hypothetical protein